MARQQKLEGMSTREQEQFGPGERLAQVLPPGWAENHLGL